MKDNCPGKGWARANSAQNCTSAALPAYSATCDGPNSSWPVHRQCHVDQIQCWMIARGPEPARWTADGGFKHVACSSWGRRSFKKQLSKLRICFGRQKASVQLYLSITTMGQQRGTKGTQMIRSFVVGTNLEGLIWINHVKPPPAISPTWNHVQAQTGTCCVEVNLEVSDWSWTCQIFSYVSNDQNGSTWSWIRIIRSDVLTLFWCASESGQHMPGANEHNVCIRLPHGGRDKWRLQVKPTYRSVHRHLHLDFGIEKSSSRFKRQISVPKWPWHHPVTSASP